MWCIINLIKWYVNLIFNIRNEVTKQNLSYSDAFRLWCVSNDELQTLTLYEPAVILNIHFDLIIQLKYTRRHYMESLGQH